MSAVRAPDVADGAVLASLEARLATLETVEAARSFVTRYAEACDAADAAAVGELVADDVVLDLAGRTYRGRAAVVDGFYAEAFRTDPSTKAHFLANVAAESLGAARVRITAAFHYTAAGRRTSVIGWGDYAFDVVVGPDRPRLERISIRIRRSVDSRDGWALDPPDAP